MYMHQQYLTQSQLERVNARDAELSGVPTERQSRSLNLVVVRPTSDSGKQAIVTQRVSDAPALSLAVRMRRCDL